MENDIGKRLLEVRNYFGVTQKEMAALLDVQRTYYSEIEGGKRPISTKIIKTLTELKPISPDWLQTGFGTMLVNKVTLDENYNKIVRLKHDLENGDEKLYNAYADLETIKYLSNSLNIFLQTIEIYDTIDLSRLKGELPPDHPLNLEYNEFFDIMSKRLLTLTNYDMAIKKFVSHLTNFLATMKPLDTKNKLPNFNPKFWPKKVT